MTKQDILEVYAPKHLFNYTLDEVRCHAGNAPTLGEIAKEHGRSLAIALVRNHLLTLATILGNNHTIDNQQLDTIAFHIVTRSPKIKITEYMLFIYRCCTGHYGKFFGKIEALDILVPFRQWANECQAWQAERAQAIANAERERMIEEREKNACDSEHALKVIASIVERFKERMQQ